MFMDLDYLYISNYDKLRELFAGSQGIEFAIKCYKKLHCV